MIYIFIFPSDVTDQNFEKIIFSIGTINVDVPDESKYKTFTIKEGRMNNDILNVVKKIAPDALCFSVDVENADLLTEVEGISTIEQIPVLRW